MLVGSGDLPQILRSQAMAGIPNTPAATTFVTAPNEATPRCPSCSGLDVNIVCYGWVCRPCQSKSPPQGLALAQSFGKAFDADAKQVAAMTQCQPEGRGGSQRAEPYSSFVPWDPTIHDGRRRWSQEWCVRMGKAKGRGTKGSGQMVSDEVMADEEMACRAKARMGGGKGRARNKAKGTGTKGSGQMVSDEVMADEEMACRAKACINALCVRMGKCGGKGAARNKAKGTGAKGSGQMVTDEEMADEEMACRRRGKSKFDFLSAFRAYEDTCINALSIIGARRCRVQSDQDARAKSPTC